MYPISSNFRRCCTTAAHAAVAQSIAHESSFGSVRGPHRSHLFAQTHFIQNRKAPLKHKIHSRNLSHQHGSKIHRILLSSRYCVKVLNSNRISVVKMVIGHHSSTGISESREFVDQSGMPQQIKRSFQRISFGRI